MPGQTGDSLAWSCFAKLEGEFQAQLHGASAARANNRVCRSTVWRGAAASEIAGRGWIVQAESILSTERICEVRMVQHVEKLSTKLCAESFMYRPLFRD